MGLFGLEKTKGHWGFKAFSFFFFFKAYLFVYFERVREHDWGSGREGGRKREPTASAEPNVGLKLMNHEIMA